MGAAFLYRRHRQALGNRHGARSGMTTVEFGLVGPIFMLAIMTVFQVSLLMFDQIMLDYQLNTVSRQVQIGTVAGNTGAITAAICDNALTLPSCTNELTIKEYSGSAFRTIYPNNVAANINAPGAWGSFMVISAQYQAPFIIPWFNQFSGSSKTILASQTAFENEPAENASP